METTVECFIEKVRNCPCLWNKNHVLYRDAVKKEIAWKHVAKQCSMTSRDAKNQWKKLRDSHREAMRRRKPEAGQSAQYLKPWKYEENMKFLMDQYESRDITLYSSESHDTMENSYQNYAETSNANIINSGQSITPDSVCADNVLYCEADIMKRKPDISDIYEEREKFRDDRELRRDELIRQIVDRNRVSDALGKFFDSLCDKTRDLPRYLQLRVQREIFDSVTRAEEEVLTMDSQMNGYATVRKSSPKEQDDESDVI